MRRGRPEGASLGTPLSWEKASLGLRAMGQAVILFDQVVPRFVVSAAAPASEQARCGATTTVEKNSPPPPHPVAFNPWLMVLLSPFFLVAGGGEMSSVLFTPSNPSSLTWSPTKATPPVDGSCWEVLESWCTKIRSSKIKSCRVLNVVSLRRGGLVGVDRQGAKA